MDSPAARLHQLHSCSVVRTMFPPPGDVGTGACLNAPCLPGRATMSRRRVDAPRSDNFTRRFRDCSIGQLLIYFWTRVTFTPGVNISTPCLCISISDAVWPDDVKIQPATQRQTLLDDNSCLLPGSPCPGRAVARHCLPWQGHRSLPGSKFPGWVVSKL